MAGLVATVITRWKADDKYSYGYVRAETLAGFINGLFLLFISFFIFSEAVERLVEPPEVKHERLLVVSILGFVVNLVSIFITIFLTLSEDVQFKCCRPIFDRIRIKMS